LLRGGQVTLPAEARKALRINEGDYLDLEVTDGRLTLKPVSVIDRAEADRQLERILSKVKYIGRKPPGCELAQTRAGYIPRYARPTIGYHLGAIVTVWPITWRSRQHSARGARANLEKAVQPETTSSGRPNTIIKPIIHHVYQRNPALRSKPTQ
jgi:AbrB family looped-hinge helix DNA binding protein